MAQRFGGRFSPGARPAGPPDDAAREARAEMRQVDAAGAKANLLFVPPVLAAFTSLGGDGSEVVLGLGAAAVLGLGARLLRHGLRAQAAYDLRPLARRPALPRKMLAAALAALGTALAVLSGAPDAVGDAILYAIAAGGLHLAAFGLDPLRDKRMEGIDTFQQDRVARVVEEAEAHLATIRDRIGALGDRGLATRVAGFEALARRLIRTVEEDPRDLTAARRYLGVYLMGARDATLRFAELYARTRDARARADYEALLGDLETNYAQRTTQLLEGGREAMDLEITVLRDRLQREGVPTDH
ncbi:5-bromo-4-chloroindolyl phosphate hydrolysis family protein [Rubellimicrobium roseum]|uniref:5-bromo-4-chloroindolyl phosphate hydrolase n=1 Tax=Rubellimicrobium roseum TaxID=687525 RepID=A0A5C4NDX0_9RHOB|nr:5-bromo-4-chloroindolyl phosphate hydrolysis family protein [Rubellimicrobium roseum]TNC71528.1 hypothetical protein FHG71_11350 [Rubellimicrobium roseum]